MTLRLNGDSSGFTEIKAADAAGDNSIKLPASNGGANQLLKNGSTAGELQYTSAGGGLHYDSSGRLLVGTSSARSNFFNGFSSWTPQHQIETAGSSSVGVRSVSFTYGRSNGDAPIFAFAKHRSDSIGGTTVVQSGDGVGIISFQASDGTDFVEAANISAAVDSTPGTDVMPGKITFSTNAGGASVAPRVEIGSNGALKLLAGCPGIDFSGIQTNLAGMTSETLDSYEEGSWTPVIATESGTPYTLGFTHARYVKVGKLVYVAFNLQFTAIGSGSITLINLPFSRASGEASIINGYVTSGNNRQSIQYSNYTSNYLLVRLDDGDSQIQYWTPKNNWAATNAFIGTGVYETA